MAVSVPPSTSVRADADNTPSSATPSCLPNYSWWIDNEYHQNPCVVARYLIDVCDSADGPQYYPINSLDLYHAHYPPPKANQASSCVCSMAVYNAIQACASCQSLDLQPSPSSWDFFTTNCSNLERPAYPYAVPSAITVPVFAWTDNSAGSFNLAVAFRQVTGRNMTTTDFFLTALPTSTSFHSTSARSTTTITPIAYIPASIVATPAPTPTFLPSKQTAAEHSVSIPAIAAGVSVAVIAFIASLVAAFYIRRRGRTRRQGVRLGSSTDLSDPTKDGSVLEKPPASVSLFLPSESFLSSRPSNSRASSYTYTTNSSSSQSHQFPRSFDDSTQSYTASSFSRSSTTDDGASNFSGDEESPFADRNREPTPSLSSARTLSSGHQTPPAAHLSTRYNRYSIGTTRSTTSGANSIASTTGAVYGRDETRD